MDEDRSSKRKGLADLMDRPTVLAGLDDDSRLR
jgi:hypothetical protein